MNCFQLLVAASPYHKACAGAGEMESCYHPTSDGFLSILRGDSSADASADADSDTRDLGPLLRDVHPEVGRCRLTPD